MKRKIILLPLLITIFTACQKKDINALKNEVNDLKTQLATLQNTVNMTNADIKSLKDIAVALQKNISVKSYTATATGYLLTMSDGSAIELKNGQNGTNGVNGTNGTNGKDGANAPTIGIKQDTDGQYYWTLAGEWLLQNGQKVRTTGKDGVNGTNGAVGNTPMLKIDGPTNYWLISYDNGASWVLLSDTGGKPVPATGPQGIPGQNGATGQPGIPGFTITENGTAVVITYMGAIYTLPKDGGGINTYKMTFATQIRLGSDISIVVDAALNDRADVWIDLNNNKKQEDGEHIGVFGSVVSYTLSTSQTVTIYGKITRLDCSHSQITELDVSQNSGLVELNCNGNILTALDVSKNTALAKLSCNVNNLTVLDVSKNTALVELSCYANQLTALDVSRNTALLELNCIVNQLTMLDVSKNTALVGLNCYYNQIKDAQMTALINSLAVRTSAAVAYILREASNEGNTMPSDTELSAAKAKQWKLYQATASGDEALLNP